ncbi:COAC-like protein [Mya arenaria]|uniref:COAC-like protein n=1 Tax=Mya arenaria TaxID=6604 RepID=A0ABY7DSL7_MYAAR|nr:phosphopantothenoylcysteine decarboxylase-like [Mya arenaria]WAR00695.1 COAC-like protein [Mya arenaria]
MANSGKFNVLLGLTGSVASIKASQIVSSLIDEKFNVKVVVSENAKHFLDIPTFPVPVIDDAEEWKGWSKRGDPVLHIELRRWADMMLIAPLDANTMAKIATGICDNLLTCVVRAWEMSKPLLLAPAMNTCMWEHPVTREQLVRLRGLGYIYIPVVEKTLVCGDSGQGAMAEVPTIIQTVCDVRERLTANAGDIIEIKNDDRKRKHDDNGVDCAS